MHIILIKYIKNKLHLLDILLKILKSIKKYRVALIIRIKYLKNMEKNIKRLYIIIFQ